MGKKNPLSLYTLKPVAAGPHSFRHQVTDSPSPGDCHIVTVTTQPLSKELNKDKPLNKDKQQGGKTTPGSSQAPTEEEYDFNVEPGDAIPEGMQPLQYARGVLEGCGVPSSAHLLDPCSQAIGFVAKAEKLELHEATRLMLGRALAAQGRGEAVNGFWFTDGKVEAKRSSNPTIAA
jgi:hypothetical protein